MNKKLKEEQTKGAEKTKIDISPGAMAKRKTYDEFAALIEAYKIQNPVKYEHKKAALEKQLEALK